MKEKLTITFLKAVQPQKEPKKDLFVWDTELPGFVLKVTPAGRKIFFAEGRVGRGRGAKLRRVTVGPWGTFTVDEAREEAKRVLRKLEQGVDPVEEKKAADLAAEQAASEAAEIERKARENAFSAVAEQFLAAVVRGRLATADAQESVIKRRFIDEWGARDITTIGRRDVNAVLDAIAAEGHSIAAIKAQRIIRPLFAFAVDREIIAANPAAGLKLALDEEARDRVLTDGELAEIWKATEGLGAPFRQFVQLLILTGQRRNEVAGMRWDELDMEAGLWTIPAARSKNGKAHVVHLAPQALAVLKAVPRRKVLDGGKVERDCQHVMTTRGDAPISGFSKCKQLLDKVILECRAKAMAKYGGNPEEAVGMEEWTFHDLRRTFSTGGARLGIAMHIVERVLNHVPVALKGVARVYQHHEFMAERKSALETWGRHVEFVTKETAVDNVVPLHAEAV